MDARAVEELRSLRARDDELAAETARLTELDAAVAEIRARAEAIDAFFARYPTAEERLRAAVAGAEADVARRRDELAAAQADAAAARAAEERAHAERALERARDHVAVAESHLLRARSAHEELERAAAALPAELPGLERRARAVADGGPAPQPGDGPRPLVEWASHAHAELFVASRQLDGERERVVREANELASMLLGEPTYGSTVAQALARVERPEPGSLREPGS